MLRDKIEMRWRVVVCTLLILFGNATYAQAGTVESVNCEELRCGLELRDSDGSAFNAPTLDTDVEIKVSGAALRAVVRQRIRNPSDEWVEGIYRFPLPLGAAVNELRMKVGERVIVGEIHERSQAEQQYQAAKQSGRKASLIKAHRPNLFTTKVANLGPGETLEIEIAYFQELALSTGPQQLRFPMVVGPRYSPPAAGANLETSAESRLPRIPTRLNVTASDNPVAIAVSVNLGVPLAFVRSLYHEIIVEQEGTAYLANLAIATTPANRDFVLEFAPAESEKPKTALLSEQRGAYQYGLMMIMPPEGEAAERLPREVTIVLDRSGSMGGTSIAQAKNALLVALDQLAAGDRFNIVQFNSESGQLFPAPETVSPETLRQARSYIAGLAATGGTEIMGALTRAFEMPGSANHLQQIIFITDGNVANETALFNYIERNLNGRRLFTVGIGSAPNHYFLQQAAQAGKGFHTAIGDLKEVEHRMTALLGRLQKPRLRDIEIETDTQDVEFWPKKIPDLYAGEPLSVAFRARPGPVTMRVAGKLPTRHWHAEVDVHGGQQRQGLAELWGQRKITSLMNGFRRSSHDPDRQAAIRQLITETALRSHLVSKFTSLVAVDKTPSNLNLESNKTKSIPRNLPHGWTLGKTGMTLPQTATSAQLRMLVGLLLLFALAIQHVLRARRCSRVKAKC